jgi:hypothetical protein
MREVLGLKSFLMLIFYAISAYYASKKGASLLIISSQESPVASESFGISVSRNALFPDSQREIVGWVTPNREAISFWLNPVSFNGRPFLVVIRVVSVIE